MAQCLSSNQRSLDPEFQPADSAAYTLATEQAAYALTCHNNAEPLRAPLILEELDESLHPLLRAAVERGLTDFRLPYEYLGPNGVEGQIELAWPEVKVGLYTDEDTAIAKRLEREGWRLLSIETRPSPAQLLELLEEA